MTPTRERAPRVMWLHDGVPRETEREYLTRRLKDAAPAEYAAYQAGWLKLHAALVAAGIRHRKLTVEIHRPHAVARALRRHMTTGQLNELLTLLITDTEGKP